MDKKEKFKADDPLFSIRFVECIEMYECIWNYTVKDYNKRDAVDKAWRMVAKEIDDTVLNCRERWKNIRTAFTRSLKPNPSGSGSKTKRTYYLSKHLQFLVPYMRSGNISTAYEDHSSTDLTYDNSLKNDLIKIEENFDHSEDNSSHTGGNCEDEDVDVEGNDEDQPMTSELSGAHQNYTLSEEPVEKKVSKKRTPCPQTYAAFVQWVESKKQKKAESNANQFFLNSLLPYMEEMTPKQNRRFRQKVVGLIDDILDDADLSENIAMPSSSASSAFFVDCSTRIPQSVRNRQQF